MAQNTTDRYGFLLLYKKDESNATITYFDKESQQVLFWWKDYENREVREVNYKQVGRKVVRHDYAVPFDSLDDSYCTVWSTDLDGPYKDDERLTMETYRRKFTTENDGFCVSDTPSSRL